DPSALLVAAQRTGDVLPPVAEEARARACELLQVHLGAAVPGGLGPRPALLALAETDQAIEVSDVALAQEAIAQHGQQGRAERDGERRRDAVVLERREHVEQWEIRLGECLEEPALLGPLRVLGVG